MMLGFSCEEWLVAIVAAALSAFFVTVWGLLAQRRYIMKKYVIVRTQSAGVFAGELESLNGMEAVMVNARRLWYWSGAASLSQLAMEGVSRPADCKFPIAVHRVVLTQAIEILDVTDAARASIEGVPVWKA